MIDITKDYRTMGYQGRPAEQPDKIEKRCVKCCQVKELYEFGYSDLTITKTKNICLECENERKKL